uniref:CSON004364 protein n=1 Tax=Culicoides sonorensis TaxID=179676 RepID=A0A336M5D6_CULSO
MSIISVITVLTCVSMAVSLPTPQGMYLYGTSPYSRNSPLQQAMYMHLYSQPLRANRPSGVSAYASGNLIKTGTYLKDAEYIKRKVNGRLHTVSSVAEASPEDNEPELLNDDADVQEDYVPQDFPEQDVPEQDVPVQDDTPLADTPLKPKKTKVEVHLDTQNDDDDDDDYAPARRGGSSGSNTYFPIKFGNTNGGAIAIANAFSNGKGGTAASRATAYGNPTKKRV